MYHLRVFLIGLADTPMPVPVMVDERQAVLVLRPLAHSEHIELRIPSAHDGLVPYNYTQRPRGLAAPCPGSSISCPLANRIQDSVTLTLCLESIGEKTAPKPPTQLFLSSYANFCAMRCHSCYPVHRHAESGNACS